MSVCVSRASTVIVHRVPPAAADQFLSLQDGFAHAAEHFPGYQGCDVYPPADATSAEWVVIIHFEEESELQAWLDSPERAAMAERVRREVGEFELQDTRAGFGSWFSSPPTDAKAEIPGWKMAMTVVLALYPTVMLLSLTVGRVTGLAGMAFDMLIGNILSVSILQWAIMPRLTQGIAPWLHANASPQRRVSLIGVAMIAAALVTMAVLFRLITG